MRAQTALGVLAIVLWSTSVAFSRSLTEALGTLTAAASIYCLAGVLAFVYVWRSPGVLQGMRTLSEKYLLVCGALFVLYMICLYAAIGLASNRPQVIVVGLINYLWPSLSLAFSLPILGRKATWPLLVGTALALGGVWLAAGLGQSTSLREALFVSGAIVPYTLALVAAISWALYSNLSRRWAAASTTGGVPLFLLASGLVLAVLRLFVHETALWSLPSGLMLVYAAVFPGMVAYLLWDVGVRKGDITLLSSISYLAPLLSTLVSASVLAVAPSLGFWLGVALVIAGAIICKLSIVEDAPLSQST
jgi:drug/metabolite transporter (DMT)-like permease